MATTGNSIQLHPLFSPAREEVLGEYFVLKVLVEVVAVEGVIPGHLSKATDS